MTRTKRIFTLLLAVVLMFGTLPFSVSADEITSELLMESTLESQPEETPAEETEEPTQADGIITISDSSGDVPVLYAQDPFNIVKSEVEGGTNYMTSVGVTRQAIVRELEAHEDDNYYLGTPYAGGDAQSPNGDTSYNSGAAGMNCAGFISYVLRKAGLDAETTMEIMHKTPVSQFGSGLPYDWLAGASNYKNLIENGNISAYAFRTKQELLSSGLAEKGDIILMWWSDTPGADSADNHIGFFWGEASDDDVMWHSGTEPDSGNQISAITPKTPGSFYILIKIEPLQPKEYTVTLTKTSADVSITQGNSAYSLAGATYNVYEGTSGTGSVVATFTTDEAGHATLSTPLEDGTYSVKEVTPPKGYKLDEKIYTFTINGADTSLSVEDEPGTLTLKLKKRDSQTGSTPQGNATLAGAVYQVSYQKGGQTVTEELTSDVSGNLGTLEGLPLGTVTVKELTAPEGYRLDTEVHTYTVDGSQLVGDTYTLEVDDLTEEVQRGGLTIQKLDSETGTTPQGDANFEGITFEVINNSRNPVMVEGQKYQPGEVVKTLVTDSEGKASTADDLLPYGEYILRESATNESMLLTAPDQTVNVTDDGVIYEFTMADEVVRGGVLIEKRDLESGLLTPLGGASLDGTLFEITNKSINAVFVGGALCQPGEVCATIEVVDGIAQTDTRALPYGTYQMVESKPGEGYLHTDQTVRSFQIRKDGEVIEFRDGDAAYNQVVRGDLQFVKVGEGGEANMGRFANVAFKLTSQTTGESHIVVTDENGEVRTVTEWNPHSQNTNGNDGVEDEAAWDDHAGTWFGLTTEGWMVDVQDELCALPYDQYTLEELPCEGNQGYELVKVPNITISRNNTTIYLGTIDDQFEGVPEIGTTATVDGEHTAEPAGEVTLVDTVTYKNLKVGQTYKLSGILMDKETSEPLLINEQQVTAELEFTPTTSEGTVELTYTFDASALAGKAVVVFEDLYQGENVVASHADINDEGQTVTFGQPEIRTTATIDGAKTAQPAGQVTITDTVEYSGLNVGQEYRLVGVLMDKETGEPLLVNDQQVTSEATFTPAESSGAIEVLFTFDASALTEKAVVVFETLYIGEEEVTSHTDIEDEGQTVTFVEGPKIGTTATVDGHHTAEPIGEITIVDVVEYTGLIPGETYSISGVLMDKATNQPLLVDDAEVTAEVEFTPESADGTVELTYTLDASSLAGTSIVVFETLYSDGVEIAAHTDINDEAQTVEITEPEKPTLGTTATVDGQHTADPVGEITIVDVVEYTGLTPSETYTISGVLMDKATGEPLLVDGAEVTAEVEFTPEPADGTVELTYTLDASVLAGTTIVVFETLYSDGVEIASHADINDEAQTITIEPRGGLLIQKTSEDGVLEGFTFLVEGEGYNQTFVTDGAGKIYIEDLSPGEYTITEQESELTARYEIPAGQTVEVTADQATTVEFYNALLRGKITGHKTGAEQAPLEGVTFGLFDVESTEFTEETAIEVTTTNDSGAFSFKTPYGTFQVMELATLPGYLTMKEPVTVEVNAAEVELEPIANNQTIVHVSKVDAETGEELPGATLELYAPDGTLIETWETSDIPHVITGLPVGEGYVLKETVAPESYQLAEDITFAVEETAEIQFVGMVDERSPEEPEKPEEPSTPDEPTEPEEPTPTVPQTGGSRAALLVGALFILALGGLGIVLILLKRTR